MKSLLLLVALVAATVAVAQAQNLSPAQVVTVPGTAPLPRAPTHFVKATIVDEAELAKYDPTPKKTPTPAPVQPAEPVPTPAVQPTAEGHYPLNMTALQEKEAWNQDQDQHERVKQLVEQALTPDDDTAAALPVDPPAESEFDYTTDGLPAEPTPAEQIDWTQEGTPLAVNPEEAQEVDYVPQEVDYVDEEVDFVPDSESTPVEAVAAAEAVRVPETVHDNIPPPGVVAEESTPAPAPAKMETESDNVPPPGLFSEGEADDSATVQPETSFDQNAIAAAEKIAEQAGSVSANATANVYSDDLARIQVAAAPGAAVQRFLAAVRSKIGRPYARGAAGPNAFDCSGLVVWAARQAGLTTLPRTADQLSKVGRAISSTSQRLPGDLIFFGKPGQKVYHVGVYVGPNQMIDAPHTGAFVRQENYSYWPDKLTVARRIF